MRRSIIALLLWLAPSPVLAQRLTLEPSRPAFWLGAGALLLGAAAADERLRDATLEHRAGGLGTLADVGDVAGRAGVLWTGVTGAYVGARIAGHDELARKLKYAYLGLAATDLAVIVLRPAIGRHRPDSTENAGDFRPLRMGHDRYALPAAHAARAFSLAAALDAQTESGWLAAAGYGAAAVVAWSRVYDDQHWTSDVVFGAVLGVVTSRSFIHWLIRQDER